MILLCILSKSRQLSFQKQSEKMRSVAHFEVGRFVGGLEEEEEEEEAEEEEECFWHALSPVVSVLGNELPCFKGSVWGYPASFSLTSRLHSQIHQGHHRLCFFIFDTTMNLKRHNKLGHMTQGWHVLTFYKVALVVLILHVQK